MASLVSLLHAILLLIAFTSANLIQHCTNEEPKTCFSIGTPDAKSSSGNGEIYLQIQAPASKQWVALAQGRVMRGSHFFIVYADESGLNVTVSPRVAQGHYEPTFDKDSQITVLDGSGIADGKMIANIRCSNCDTWKGGAMDLSASSTSWIYAHKVGPPLKSDSETFHLNIHDHYSGFQVDLTQANVGASLNPFVESSEPVEEQKPNTGEGDMPSGGLGLAVPIHGIIMSVAFILAFPIGAILIRLAPVQGSLRFHAALQLIAYMGVIMGAAAGYYVATRGQSQLRETHPATGMLVVILLLAQPILGYVHHKRYVQYQRATLFTLAHVWYGRVLLTLGLMNGWLGLRLAGQSWFVQAIYTLAAVVMWLTWMGSIFLSKRNDDRVKKQRGEFRLATLTEEEEEEDADFRD